MLVFGSIVLGLSIAAAAVPTAPSVGTLTFGEPFPAETYANLNPDGGDARIDLGEVVGKKPVVLVYVIPTNGRSENTFSQIADMVDEQGADAVALFAVTAVSTGFDTTPIRERIQELGWTRPVLMDEDFKLGRALNVQTVPSITVIDKGGILRLANAGSLKQDLEYKMTVRDGLARLAKSGTIGTYGSLPRYDPAQELVGQQAPDFMAPACDGIVRKLSTMLDPRKVNVLVYWSVECSHCRKSLPQINDWYKRNGSNVNLLTAAKCDNDAMKVRTKEFTKLHGFAFPTVLDEGSEIFEMYKITATPTMFVVAPDGTIESLLSVNRDFGPQVEAKVRELLPDEKGG
jgi:peroxiredoxin